MQENKNKKIIYYGVIFLVLLIVYYFLNQKINLKIPCIFHTLTGYYCPGCGITRMLFSLLNLNFYQAFRYNPLVFILLFGYIIIKIIEILTKHKFQYSNKFQISLLIITILFGILRNIETFSFLLPTTINYIFIFI